MGKLMKNFYYNLIYQVFAILLPFFLTPYLARKLGAEAMGIYSYTNSIILLFSTFGMMGITTYSNREIAYCTTKGKEVLSKTFWSLCYIRFFLFVITVIVYGLTVLSFAEYKDFFVTQIVLLAYYFSDVSWVFVGLEKMKTIVCRNFIVKIISTLLILFVVREENDLQWYILINGIGMFIGNVLMFPQVAKYITFVRIKKREIVKHILPMMKLFLPQAASSIYVILDKSMIKWFTEDVKKVGFYDQSQLIVKMPLVIVASLSTIVMPRISHEHILGNKVKIKSYIEKILNFIVVFAFPVSMGMIGVSATFVPVYLGDEYLECISIIELLAIVIVPISLTNITGVMFLTACNYTKALTVSYVVSSVINVLFNICLIPRFGVYGATIGTLSAEFMVLIIQYRYMMKYLGSFNLIKRSAKPFFCSVIMLYAVLLISNVGGDSLKTIFVQIIVGILAYLFGMFILKDKIVLEYGFEIRKLFHEKKRGKSI